MKILVFTHRSNFSGGANRSLLAVLCGLRDKGHQIKVILPRKNGELNNALSKENIPWEYFRFYRMGAKRFKGIAVLLSYAILYGKLIHHYIVSKKISKVLKDEKYDVIYTNTILPYAGLFLSKKYNIPSVIHDREPLSTVNVPQIVNFEKFLYTHAQKIIVISRDLMNQWKERGFEKNIVLINNGIPIQEVICAKQDNQNCFNILLTARISPTKRHMDALNALRILKEKGINNIHIFFAGSEGERKDSEYHLLLNKYISDNGLENEVTFLGEVSNMSVLRSKMNVELMCNPDEPFGRVTVEGMRSGLVVIGVNAGGTLDIIEDGKNGLLYRNGDINDLVNKIELVYNNIELRKKISQYAYTYSNTNFTMEENVEKIENILWSVAKK